MFSHILTTYTDPRLGLQYRATVYLNGQWWMEWTGSLDYVTGHLTDAIRAPDRHHTVDINSTPTTSLHRMKGTPL